MERSFAVCWDRVFPNAWSADDEAAVANHKAVLYVLSPPMEQHKAVAYSAAALRIAGTQSGLVIGATRTSPRCSGLSDRIAAAFASHGRKAALMPYLMGGFPDLDTSRAVGEACADAGADAGGAVVEGAEVAGAGAAAGAAAGTFACA